MATIKSHTDIPQSKKLAKFLPLKSADMHYNSGYEHDICFGSGIYKELTHWICDRAPRPADIPCWSLAALLRVIPDYTLQTNRDGTVFVVCESKKPMVSDAYDNPVDACVEMILKLHEKKIL